MKEHFINLVLSHQAMQDNDHARRLAMNSTGSNTAIGIPTTSVNDKIFYLYPYRNRMLEHLL